MTLLRFSFGVPTADIVAGIITTAFPDAVTAIDLTPGHGRFWNAEPALCVHRSTDDFREVLFLDRTFDLSLYDPPHVADGGQNGVMSTRYGTYRNDDLEVVVRQGVREAWRVARLGAVVKVTDGIHAQRFVRMSGWIYDELGEPYDVVHQVRAHNFADPKWKGVYSARNNGASYLIFRRGDQRHKARV